MKIKCECPICKNVFYVKPSRIKRVKTTICCSKKCSNKLKETTFKGENNHQFGLIGSKNSSYVGKEIISNLGYILEDCPGHPKPCDKSTKTSRVRQHRLVIERNYSKFDSKYFENINGWIVLKDEYDVHHKNEIKTDNRLENLEILTRSEHTKLHNDKKLASKNKNKLLENNKINQQPNDKGSTTT